MRPRHDAQAARDQIIAMIREHITLLEHKDAEIQACLRTLRALLAELEDPPSD